MRGSARRTYSPRVWSGACLAAVIGIALLLPWPTPSPEVALDQFDPALITIDLPRTQAASGARVQVTEHEITLTAAARSQPTVHLFTTEVPFRAAFSVRIVARRGAAYPFRLKVWNPRSDAAIESWYNPDGTIQTGVRQGDRWGRVAYLGPYTLGRPSLWRIARDAQGIVLTREEEGQRWGMTLDRSAADLVAAPLLAVTVFATAPPDADAVALVGDPLFTVTQQTSYGTTVRSRWYAFTVSLLALLSLIWLSAWLLPVRFPRLALSNLLAVLAIVGILAVVVGIVAGDVAHPVDATAIRAWSHIAGRYGPQALPGRSLLASGAAAYGGQPYGPVTFPYPPLLLYIFWLVGRLLPAAQTLSGVKILMGAAVGAGAGLLFVLLRSVGTGRPAALLAAGAYGLNPAVLFDVLVWGQTDALVALFLLTGAAGIVRGSAVLLWLGLLLAAATKQTGALVAAMLVPLGIVHFGLRRLGRALTPALLIFFLVLAPLLIAGLHPSAITRPILTKGRQFGTVAGMETVNAVIAQGAFTVWTAAAGREGARGLERMAAPDYIPTRLGPTYFALSRVTFGIFAAAVVGLLLVGRRGRHAGGAFLALAAYSAGTALLLTRVQPRYLYFGLMFVAASLPWLPRGLGGGLLTVISGIMLVGMWGTMSLTSLWYPGLLPLFHPERGGLDAAMAGALSSDVVITTAGVLATGALVVLLVAIGRASGPGTR